MILVGGELWVTGSFGVMRIDPASSRVLGEIPVKDGVCGASVAQSRGPRLDVGLLRRLDRIDVATHVSRRISTEVKVSAAVATEHAVWATDLYGQLVRVDPRRGRIVDTFDLSPVKGLEADAPEIVSDHRGLWIADFPTGASYGSRNLRARARCRARDLPTRVRGGSSVAEGAVGAPLVVVAHPVWQ
jgi:hypothetical protein